ncbi:hypothetical protein HL658_01365 [Azospirillum sp. RWY-5-1]|uniref:Uncharacterized protein n=1 Tax=Azospirillum oleiclasticum TaxID=2735135 RepID=A0ABX2T205_9PROT|nr:hypothetical protein [Azospirillum oleiclasticum]NYZ11182.1 hypothetical protein [Azospirillum oleiclasticum]NYZ18344.1 hypothetical protein [Azospirillum oleiclasticum]
MTLTIDAPSANGHVIPMASPAPKPPAGNTPDNAAVLAAIGELGDRMERRFEKLDERMRRLETDGAEMKGRVSQLPTLWQVAALIFAIFGAAFTLIRFAPPH